MDIRKVAKKIAYYLVPSAIIVYIIAIVGIDEIAHTLSGISIGLFFLGFCLFALNHFWRSLRIRTLILSRKPKLTQMFKINCYYMALNYFMPARSGEVSLVYLLKKRENVPISQGLAILVVARLLDFLNIAFFLPLVVILMWDQLGSRLIVPVFCFLGFLAVLFCTVFFFTFRGERVLSFLNKTFSFFRLTRIRLFELILKKMEDLQQNFKIIHFSHFYLRLLGLTLLIWISVYVYVYIVIRLFSVDITLLNAVVVVLFLVPTRLFPIQGVGNFGSHEVGWSAALILLGLPQERAMAVALSSHLVIMIYVVILVFFARFLFR